MVKGLVAVSLAFAGAALADAPAPAARVAKAQTLVIVATNSGKADAATVYRTPATEPLAKLLAASLSGRRLATVAPPVL